MAHFAKIEDGLVTRVIVVNNRELLNDNNEELESLGLDFLARSGFEGNWVMTSYNTRGGVHYKSETGEPSADQSKALRFNYAGLGYTYDAERDGFIEPKPYDSWILDESTCLWVAPVDYPTDGLDYTWDEETTSWVEVPGETV